MNSCGQALGSVVSLEEQELINGWKTKRIITKVFPHDVSGITKKVEYWYCARMALLMRVVFTRLLFIVHPIHLDVLAVHLFFQNPMEDLTMFMLKRVLKIFKGE